MVAYLAYGANTHLDRMAQTCPNSQLIGKAWLHDHKLVFRYHADIEPCKGSVVCGVLWEVTEQDLMVLDEIEGYPNYYTRIEVMVHTDSLDAPVSALVYSMVDKSYEQPPRDQYLGICCEGYKQNGLLLDQISNALGTDQ